MLLLFLETSAEVITPPTGWQTAITSSVGTPGDVAATRLTVFWKIAVTGETDPVVVTNPGDHLNGHTIALRVATAGDQFFFDTSATSNLPTASSTATMPAITTSGPNRLVI